MPDIAVVDYGTGNLRSVAKALMHVAPERSTVVTSDAAVIRDARRVVLPGQSAMPDCMANLARSGLRVGIWACVVHVCVLSCVLCENKTLTTFLAASSSSTGWDRP